MIQKILCAMVVALAIMFAWSQWENNRKSCRIEDLNGKVDELQTKLEVARKNEETYKKQLEKEHNDKIELGKRYEELETAAKVDTAFNWGADIANSDVVKQLRANAIRLQGS